MRNKYLYLPLKIDTKYIDSTRSKAIKVTVWPIYSRTINIKTKEMNTKIVFTCKNLSAFIRKVDSIGTLILPLVVY